RDPGAGAGHGRHRSSRSLDRGSGRGSRESALDDRAQADAGKPGLAAGVTGPKREGGATRMNHHMATRSLRGKAPLRTLLLALLLVAAPAIAVAPGSRQPAQEKVDRLSAQEFSRLVQ